MVTAAPASLPEAAGAITSAGIVPAGAIVVPAGAMAVGAGAGMFPTPGLVPVLYSTSPITPPVRVRVPDVENLRPRRVGRQLPDGPPPKSTKGWTFSEVAAAIERCGLRGEWRQGGQQSRSIYVGDEFIINIQSKRTTGMQWWQSMTVWVQGLRANEINTRLCAARSA